MTQPSAVRPWLHIAMLGALVWAFPGSLALSQGHFQQEAQTDRVGADLIGEGLSTSRLDLLNHAYGDYRSSWRSASVPFEGDTRTWRVFARRPANEPPCYSPNVRYRADQHCREQARAALETECAGNCALNRGCMAYTFVARPHREAPETDYLTQCWLKGSAPDPVQRVQMTTGVKYVEGARFTDWYMRRYTDTDIQVGRVDGDDLPGRDIERYRFDLSEAECAGHCARNRDCTGYSYIYGRDGFPMLSEGRCWLKGADRNGRRPAQLQPARAVNSAVKVGLADSPAGEPYAVESIRTVPINRAQIRIETGRVGGAATGDPVLLELNVPGSAGTFLKRNRDDFASGDIYTYDIRLDERWPAGGRILQSMADVLHLKITKPGSDAWCLRSVVLRINGRPIFSKVLTTDEHGQPQECQWIGNGRPSTLTVSDREMSGHTSWRNFGPYESLLVPNPPAAASPYRADFSELRERFAAVIHDIFMENGWRGDLRLSKRVGAEFLSGPFWRGRLYGDTLLFPFWYQTAQGEKEGAVAFDYRCSGGHVSYSAHGVYGFDTPVSNALLLGEIDFGLVDRVVRNDQPCATIRYHVIVEWPPEWGSQVDVLFEPAR